MNDVFHNDPASTGTMREPSRFSSVKSFLFSLFGYAGGGSWLYFGLLVLLGFAEGAGLVLLIPLLDLVGFNGGANPDRTSLLVRTFCKRTGLPFTLETVLCAYIVINGIYAAAGRYLQGLGAKLSFGYTQCMQDRIYQAFAGAEWLCSNRLNGADVIRVLTSDLVRVGDATRRLFDLLATIVLTFIYLGVVISVSSLTALFALGSTAVIFIFLRKYTGQVHKLAEQFQTATKNLYFLTNEHVSGMKIAKSYGLEKEHTGRFSSITKEVAEKGIRFLQVDAATQMYHQVGAAVALSALFYIGAKMLAIPAASLIFVVFVFARLSPKVSLIQHFALAVSNSLPAYRAAIRMLTRLESADESPPLIDVAPLPLTRNIRLSRISFAYDERSGAGEALCEIDLVIPARSTVAVVGASGSGKTTLADLIMGLVSPVGGSIFIDDTPLEGELVYRWRSSIGYVPQEAFLFNDTIRANLLLVRPGAAEGELWEALRNAAADTFVSQFPDGLDTVVGERGSRLSGGERQRIALARALLRKPSVLILDEATSSLDRENELRILHAIDELHGELTMVVIAHRLSTIRRADNIVVLEKGRVVESGAWASLSRKKGGWFRTQLALQN